VDLAATLIPTPPRATSRPFNPGDAKMNVSATIENGTLVIRLPLYPKPTPSATGKTLVVASTRGNHTTDVKIDGSPVVIGVNAYVKP
jgi:hypothetical protein